MVLQRAPRQAVVWGYAERAGAEVTLEIAGQRKQTTSIQGIFGHSYNMMNEC